MIYRHISELVLYKTLSFLRNMYYLSVGYVTYVTFISFDNVMI